MDSARLVATSDCERIRPGPISQPWNAASSLAYVAAGAWVARRARTRGDTDGPAMPVAAALVLNGVGSVAYHGPGGRFGKWLHDSGLVAVNATLAVGRLDRVRRFERVDDRVVGALLTAVAAAILAFRPRAELAVTAPLAVVAVGQEVIRPSTHGRAGRLAGGALLVVGTIVHTRSRSGQPWCRPDGPFHGHALWHVLSAAGLALVADAAADHAGGRAMGAAHSARLPAARSLDR